MEDKDLIAAAIDRQLGRPVAEWRDDPENGITAVIGRYTVTEDDDEHGLYSGDEGELTACRVGAPEYGNVRVAFSFTTDGLDGGNDVPDPSILDPVA